MTIPDIAVKGPLRYRFHSGPWQPEGKEAIFMDNAISLLEDSNIPHVTRKMQDGRVCVYRSERGFIEVDDETL